MLIPLCSYIYTASTSQHQHSKHIKKICTHFCLFDNFLNQIIHIKITKKDINQKEFVAKSYVNKFIKIKQPSGMYSHCLDPWMSLTSIYIKMKSTYQCYIHSAYVQKNPNSHSIQSYIKPTAYWHHRTQLNHTIPT